MSYEDTLIETKYLGNKRCHDTYPHNSHDWHVFNRIEVKIGIYRCYGLAIPEPEVEVREVTISDMAKLWGPNVL